MKTPVGIVQSIVGKFFEKDSHGNVIELKVGDRITENKIIFGDSNNPASAAIKISMVTDHNNIIALHGSQEQLFDSSLVRDENTVGDVIAKDSVLKAWNVGLNTGENTIADNAKDKKDDIANEETAAGQTQAKSHSTEDVFALRDGDAVRASSTLRDAPFHSAITTSETVGQIAVVTSLNSVNPILNPDYGNVNESAMSNGTAPSPTGAVAIGNLYANDILPSGASLASVAIIGGATDTSVLGRITVTTAQGNTLVVNTTTGDYTYTLLHPLDHTGIADNILTDSFTYIIDGSNGSAYSSTLNIAVHDDSPVINGAGHVDILAQGAMNTNLIFTLDVSGSMNNLVSGSLTLTEFDLARTAIINTITAYEKLGNVNIDLSLFSTDGVNVGAYINDGTSTNGWPNSNGSVWLNATQAIDFLNNNISFTEITGHPGQDVVNIVDNHGHALYYIPDQNNTNFEEALNATQLNYASPTTGQTLAYFLSDGTPNFIWVGATGYHHDNVNPVNPTASDITAWDNFISSNHISLQVIATAGADTGSLELIHGADTTNSVYVADITVASGGSSLEDTLAPNSLLHTTGSLVSVDGSTGVNFGADGGHIQTVQYLGENSVSGPSTTYSYDQLHLSQTITLSDGSTMALDFSNGNFIYTPHAAISSDIIENFNITVVDGDGDTASKAVNLLIGQSFTYDGSTAITADSHDYSMDTISLATGVNLNNNIDFSNLHNIEQINLSQNGSHNIGATTTGLQLGDVLNMTNVDVNNNRILEITDITGKSDSVTLQNTGTTDVWNKSSTQVVENGHTYNEYTNSGDTSVTVKVDENITNVHII